MVVEMNYSCTIWDDPCDNRCPLNVPDQKTEQRLTRFMRLGARASRARCAGGASANARPPTGRCGVAHSARNQRCSKHARKHQCRIRSYRAPVIA